MHASRVGHRGSKRSCIATLEGLRGSRATPTWDAGTRRRGEHMHAPRVGLRGSWGRGTRATRTLEVIGGHQRSLGVIRGDLTSLEVIRGH
jgi:hypothetical protein